MNGSISVCYIQRSARCDNIIDSTRVNIWLELLVCDILGMIFLIQKCMNTKLPTSTFQNKYLIYIVIRQCLYIVHVYQLFFFKY